MPKFRNDGHGSRLLGELPKTHSKLCCIINEGNEPMYRLLSKNGFRREKLGVTAHLLSNSNEKRKSKWWSNYLKNDEYEKYS